MPGREGRLRACASAARGSRDADWGTHESLHHRILLEARRPPRGWRDDRSARSERSGRVGAGDVARLGPVAFGAVRNGLRGHQFLLATSASADLLVATTTKSEQVRRPRGRVNANLVMRSLLAALKPSKSQLTSHISIPYHTLPEITTTDYRRVIPSRDQQSSALVWGAGRTKERHSRKQHSTFKKNEC